MLNKGRVKNILIIFMEYSMEGYPPVPIPWKIINSFHIILLNKVRMNHDILKSNKIGHDS